MPIGAAGDPLALDSCADRLGDTRPIDTWRSEDAFLAAVDREIAYAFQPLVHLDTGLTEGCEALLRGVEGLGIKAIPALFDAAAARGWLVPLERLLRSKALHAFSTLTEDVRLLFFNVDPRLTISGPGIAEEILEAIDAADLPRSRFCLEIPENQDIRADDTADGVFRRLRSAGVKLALDDFGQGYSRLQFLNEHRPDFVKIDRYFISGIAADPERRRFLARIVEVMHGFGIRTVAEGVETDSELAICRALGFDLAQGYVIQRPTTDPAAIRSRYDIVLAAKARDRRNRSGDARLLRDQIETLPTLDVDLGMAEVFDAFRLYRDLSLFPVVDRERVPIGVIRDVDLKAFVYSPYGRDLMANKSYGKRLSELVQPCPTISVDMPIERVLEAFARQQDAPGLLVVDGGRYAGFLSTVALLRAVHEKNLAVARDQNPLTRLPGNLSIADYVAQALAERDNGWVLAYLDFDNFKPFNDAYGFRQGDRAIQLFADLLGKSFGGGDAFIGHVGGDDFFVGFRDVAPERVRADVGALLDRFRHEVESFYDATARERGFIEGKGRDGAPARFGLMTCSAAVLVIEPGRAPGSVEHAAAEIAHIKRRAKSDGGVAMATIGRGGAAAPGAGPEAAPEADGDQPRPVARRVDTLHQDG